MLKYFVYLYHHMLIRLTEKYKKLQKDHELMSLQNRHLQVAAVGNKNRYLLGHIQQGFRFFFQDWWAEVTHGAENGGSFSEMMAPSISN